MYGLRWSSSMVRNLACNTICKSAPVPVTLGRNRMDQCNSVLPTDCVSVISPWWQDSVDPSMTRGREDVADLYE